MTTEQMIKAIIKAQCAGGFTEYRSLLNGWKLSLRPKSKTLYAERIDEGYARKVDEDDYICDYISFPILGILFDVDGLKAAYGDVFYDEDEEMEEDNGIILNGAPCDVFQSDIGTNIIRKRLTIGWNATAHEILSCWLIESTKSAIKTAYDLLP